MHLQMTKRYGRKKKYTIQYAILILCTIPKLRKIKNKNIYKKLSHHAKSQWQSPNFIRSNQESPCANSLVINTVKDILAH